MGTWGLGSFENDAAMDWLFAYADHPTAKTLLDALLDSSGDNDQEAVAAAEVVARAHGRPSTEYTELEEQEALPEPDLTKARLEEIRRVALTTIQRISSASDLPERWYESDEGQGALWQLAMNALIERLTA